MTLADELERLADESQLGIGDWEWAPATRGYITTIFGRTLLIKIANRFPVGHQVRLDAIAAMGGL